MSRAFSSVAHSYDVRASEERRAREPRMRCLVRFLDDSEHAFLLEVSALRLHSCLLFLLSGRRKGRSFWSTCSSTWRFSRRITSDSRSETKRLS